LGAGGGGRAPSAKTRTPPPPPPHTHPPHTTHPFLRRWVRDGGHRADMTTELHALGHPAGGGWGAGDKLPQAPRGTPKQCRLALPDPDLLWPERGVATGDPAGSGRRFVKRNWPTQRRLSHGARSMHHRVNQKPTSIHEGGHPGGAQGRAALPCKPKAKAGPA
jgi:hypothetical protein